MGSNPCTSSAKSYQFKSNKRLTPYRVQGRMQLVNPMLQFVACLLQAVPAGMAVLVLLAGGPQ